MNKKLYFFIAALMLCAAAAWAQPKQEIRAVWLTTNSGLDWPSSTNIETQKSSLQDILDKLQAANFNTILLQVQVKGDVIWDSSYQPSMKVFTGDGSKNLSWNVCKYVIDECHNRGMECHAWIVPYRIGTANEAKRYASNPKKHPYLAHPEWCILYNNAYYLDPGLPEVRQYLLDLYRELIANYDFDGTNFDYTRYPTTSLTDFNDDASYNKYGNGMSRANWRRQNINTFVHDFYDMAKSIKPGIKVGSAPIGTYKRAPGYGNMEAYGVFQDPVEWMNAGKHDIAFPQLYWNEKYGFTPHMNMWAELTNYSRHIVAGLAPYKMTDSNNWEVSEITGQIEKARDAKGIYGVCFFRTEQIISTSSKYAQLYTELTDNYFKYPANIPPMDFNGVTKPNAPKNVRYEFADGKYTITWDAPDPDENGTPIKYYCVYRAARTAEIGNMEKCIGHYITDCSFSFDSADQNLTLAITSFDNNYYESSPTFLKVSGIDGTSIVAKHIEITPHSVRAALDVDIVSAHIVSAQGATVAMATPAGNEVEIGIDALPHGFYAVVIKAANGNVFSEKFIK